MININYKRRHTCEVKAGGVTIGGSNPIRLQSMLNVSTMDTDACVEQASRIVDAGGEIVRLTAQGTREAKNLQEIHDRLRTSGCNVPLVADVHFNPKVADEAALHVEKVRINPGNYANSVADMEEKFPRLLQLCKEHGTALRIGVNHGSLNKRMVEKYGDTAEGMTESCLEYLRLCKSHDFDNVVLSVKASNVRVMVQTVRMLCRRMDEEGMDYPLHLGVTEAGEGEDGRIKSAVGIGTLLSDGIGDTIRVSLSEDPAAEIPVARRIVDFITRKSQAPLIDGSCDGLFDPETYARRPSRRVAQYGGGQVPEILRPGDKIPEGVKELRLTGQNALGQGRMYFQSLKEAGDDSPVVISKEYATTDLEQLQVEASIELGALFLDGFGDGIRIIAPNIPQEKTDSLMAGILQATRCRMSKTEYISCPGCGRTLFDLQGTIAKVKAATSGMPNLKIAVMGCIVNGPGEMADADYGYVGAGIGRVSLYKGRQCVVKNIPETEAVERLLELISD